MKHTCWSGDLHDKNELNMNFIMGCINVLLFSLIIKPTCYPKKLPKMMYFTFPFLPRTPCVMVFLWEHTPPSSISYTHDNVPLFVTTYNPLSLSAAPLDRLYLPTETLSMLACAVTSTLQELAEQEVYQHPSPGQNAWSVTPAHSDQCRDLWIAIPRTHSK